MVAHSPCLLGKKFQQRKDHTCNSQDVWRWYGEETLYIGLTGKKCERNKDENRFEYRVCIYI